MRSTSTQPSDAEYRFAEQPAGETTPGARRRGRAIAAGNANLSRPQRKANRRGLRAESLASDADNPVASNSEAANLAQPVTGRRGRGRRPNAATAAASQSESGVEASAQEDSSWQEGLLTKEGRASRRGGRWRENLYAHHSVTKSGFPTLLAMRPVLAFLMVPGLIVLGITITGGHWPKAVLYPLAMAMGLYVLLSAFRGVELVLAVLLLYVPFSPVYVIPLAPGINGTNSLIALGLLATVVHARTNRISWFNRRPGTVLILLYAIITSLSGITIMFQPDGYHYLMGDEFHNYKGWIEQFLIYFIALSSIRDHATAKRIFFYMCIGSVLVVIYTLPEMYSKMGLSTIEKSRVTGPLAQSNEFGGFLAYTLMLTGGLFLGYMKNIKAWALTPFFLLALKLLISTFSRGAYLALAGGGFIAGWLRGKAFMAFWAMIGLGFFAIFPQFIPESIVARFGHSIAAKETTYGPAQLDKSSEHRLILWKAAADMTLESPITGKGFKGFQKMKHLYTERPVHEKDPHNYYLYVASQMGLPAVAIFLLIMLYVFYLGWSLSKNKDDQYIRSMGIAGGAAAATYGAVLMFGSRAVNPEFTAYFWVLVVCMQVLHSSSDPQAVTKKLMKRELRRNRMAQSAPMPSLDSHQDQSAAPLSSGKKARRALQHDGREGRRRTNAFEGARQQQLADAQQAATEARGVSNGNNLPGKLLTAGTAGSTASKLARRRGQR